MLAYKEAGTQGQSLFMLGEDAHEPWQDDLSDLHADICREVGATVQRGSVPLQEDLGGWFRWDGCRFAPKNDAAVYLSVVDYVDRLRLHAEAIEDEEVQKPVMGLVKSLCGHVRLGSTVKGAAPFLHLGAQEFDAAGPESLPEANRRQHNEKETQDGDGLGRDQL
jgi:hypothetical protein